MYTTKYRNCTPGTGAHFFDDFRTRDAFGKAVRNEFSNPGSNVKEGPNSYTIELAVPGMEKSDFNIKLEQDTLTISSEKKAEQPMENERYTRREFHYNAFSRAFSIPETVDTNSIAATYEKGVLTIALPKKPEAAKPETKKIEVA